MPFIVLGWHFYTFFRSKSVDLKDFIPFLVERSVVCGDVTAYLMTRCPRWWMRTWTWKPCFRQEFVDVSVFFMFCWCFVDIFMASDGSLPMTGDSRMNPLSNARHRRNGSRVWSTSWTQTWPDMAWHGRTALLENMSTQGSQFQRRTGESWWIMKTNRVFAWLAKNWQTSARLRRYHDLIGAKKVWNYSPRKGDKGRQWFVPLFVYLKNVRFMVKMPSLALIVTTVLAW